MHDPLVVAFTVVRPWPQRSSMPAPRNGRRWAVRLHHECHEPYCTDHGCNGNPFPWWKPRSYSRFWRLAGREYHWPGLVTVWHREPGGRDSGEVCKHTRRIWDESKRQWQWVRCHAWRWHVHHWKIQVHPLQNLRRALLTRCAWCGGRSRKGDLVNFSHSWDGERSRWWQGERGLFHEGCSSVERAHRLCLCAVPALADGRNYGDCTVCGKFHPWNHVPDQADRLLAAIPHGGRITPGIRPMVEAAWAERRARREAATP